jgi:hypothetical protein
MSSFLHDWPVDEPIPYVLTPKSDRFCDLLRQGYSSDDAEKIADAEYADDGFTLREASA